MQPSRPNLACMPAQFTFSRQVVIFIRCLCALIKIQTCHNGSKAYLHPSPECIDWEIHPTDVSGVYFPVSTLKDSSLIFTCNFSCRAGGFFCALKGNRTGVKFVSFTENKAQNPSVGPGYPKTTGICSSSV